MAAGEENLRPYLAEEHVEEQLVPGRRRADAPAHDREDSTTAKSRLSDLDDPIISEENH